MFKPKYGITPKIAGALMRIESAKEAVPIPADRTIGAGEFARNRPAVFHALFDGD